MKPAPPFYVTAIGAGRVVGGPPGPSTPLLLIFHDHAGAETAFQVNATLRAHYPKIEQLQVASIVGLHHVPRFMRSTVEQSLHAAYRHAASAIPAGLSPSDYVLIAPDWEGKVTGAFGMEVFSGSVGLVLLVKPWQIFDTYLDNDPCNAALRLVTSAFAGTPKAPAEPTALL